MPLQELAPAKDEAAGSARKSVIIGSAIGATMGLAGLALCISVAKKRNHKEAEHFEGVLEA
jgi:Ca2+/H+ antiporter